MVLYDPRFDPRTLTDMEAFEGTELLREATERANREDAPFFAAQLIETALVIAGRLDPASDEVILVHDNDCLTLRLARRHEPTE